MGSFHPKSVVRIELNIMSGRAILRVDIGFHVGAFLSALLASLLKPAFPKWGLRQGDL